MKITPIFAWYDFWIGWFWDSKKHRLYIFPVPMLGIYVTLYGRKCWLIRKRGYFYRSNAQGYTQCLSEAGRYTLEEAKKHEYPHDEPVTIHHVRDFL